jgi:hypothetical protein
MDYRKWNRRLQWGLVALVAALHAAIYFWREDPAAPNFVLMAAHDAQLLVASGLIVGWIVLGPGWLWLRVAAAPVLVGLLFFAGNGQMQPRDTPNTFMLTVFCCTVVLIAVLRGWGWQVVRSVATKAHERGAQFSLLALLATTTAIAAAIGALEALRPVISATDGGPLLNLTDSLSMSRIVSRAQHVREFVLSAAVSAAAVGGLWAMLRPGGTWLRLGGLVALIPVAAAYLAHLSESANDAMIVTAQNLAMGLAAVAGLVAISVLPLRLLGFRLQRPNRSSQPTPAQPIKTAPWIERTAAAIIVCLALLLIPGSQIHDSRSNWRLSWNSLSWGTPHAAIAPPLNAFGQWIDHFVGSEWTTAQVLEVYFGTSALMPPTPSSPHSPSAREPGAQEVKNGR